MDEELTKLTLQSLQQSPLLHMALWVRVHFLQQLTPLSVQSYKDQRGWKRKVLKTNSRITPVAFTFLLDVKKKINSYFTINAFLH